MFSVPIHRYATYKYKRYFLCSVERCDVDIICKLLTSFSVSNIYHILRKIKIKIRKSLIKSYYFAPIYEKNPKLKNVNEKT